MRVFGQVCHTFFGFCLERLEKEVLYMSTFYFMSLKRKITIFNL